MGMNREYFGKTYNMLWVNQFKQNWSKVQYDGIIYDVLIYTDHIYYINVVKRFFSYIVTVCMYNVLHI